MSRTRSKGILTCAERWPSQDHSRCEKRIGSRCQILVDRDAALDAAIERGEYEPAPARPLRGGSLVRARAAAAGGTPAPALAERRRSTSVSPAEVAAAVEAGRREADVFVSTWLVTMGGLKAHVPDLVAVMTEIGKRHRLLGVANATRFADQVRGQAEQRASVARPEQDQEDVQDELTRFRARWRLPARS